ncbi:MAG: Spy/CpxP family protein refolding chaperone [Phenylobacterium sp.]|uniref:Spy/CpxP family protein refolding chaperone n=1 Tax=Phenylobacterium sp. TaxID=1871053 RepID=UPI001A613DD3|nr:Spy/CpxP family protein refolding chaperone [Phenylobacterium sp.]MBL8769790.1 Spy/CpxP family protein refolding chaperone [Phenylobacterium sp.]
MSNTTTWLLAGAAFALCAGGAIAAASPETAAREAEADARDAMIRSREAAMASREQAREAREAARERAHEAAARAREAGERAREAALEAARYSRELGSAHRDFAHFDHGEGRAEYLTRALQLRPDQTPALSAFLEATKRQGRHEVRLDRSRGDGRTTLQRLDDMQARMAEQQAEAGRRIAAVRTFYGQLDATQQKAFDSMPMLMLVGPAVGPMVLPGPMPVVLRAPPAPPVPPTPPSPPSSL